MSIIPPSEHTGHLFMIVAPSGAGKSTLVNALLEQDPDLCLSISSTTRTPRPNELNGQAYHFLTTEEFLAQRQRNEFLESAEVHGYYYGTSRLWIEQKIRSGRDVLMEIDWQGAQQVRMKFKQSVWIFILPPSITALEERLKKRGQDESWVIVRRLLAAGGEMAHVGEADYVIVNENFKQALHELSSIITATRLRLFQQRLRHAALFSQLGIHFPKKSH